MTNLITAPFAWVMRLFYSLTGSYGLALLLFTLVVKLIMLPFQIKSKKSMVRMGRLRGKQKELEKKYANNKMKYQEELQKLYTEAGVNPMGGCLWSFLPLAILIPLYSIIRQPLTSFMRLSTDTYEQVKDLAVSLGHVIGTGATATSYEQIGVAQFVYNNWEKFTEFEPMGLMPVNFKFLGIDLTAIPTDAFKNFDLTDWGGCVALILIPVLSGVLSFVLSKVTSSSNGQETPANMKGMLITMPLMSVYIGFILPASLGIYWIYNSLFSILQEATLGKYFNKKIQAEEDEREEKREAARKLRMEEAKRQALEQKENPKPQKKPQEKKPGEKKPSTNEAGRIGDRPYARGRSYVENRYDEQ